MTGVKVYEAPNGGDEFFNRSDNLSFADHGVPSHTAVVAFDYPDYHAVGGEWRKIDYDNMAKVDRMLALGMLLIADSERTPKWDAEKAGHYATGHWRSAEVIHQHQFARLAVELRIQHHAVVRRCGETEARTPFDKAQSGTGASRKAVEPETGLLGRGDIVNAAVGHVEVSPAFDHQRGCTDSVLYTSSFSGANWECDNRRNLLLRTALCGTALMQVDTKFARFRSLM
jgi:hypothetical protein